MSGASGGGLGFTGALTLLFVALKLTHVIGWSWWLVLSPLWVAACLVALLLLGLYVAAVVSVARDERRRRARSVRRTGPQR